MNALTTMTWRTGRRESQWHNQLTDLGGLRLFGSKGASQAMRVACMNVASVGLKGCNMMITRNAGELHAT